MKEPLRGQFTLIAVATQILLGILTVNPRQIAWLHQCANPP